MNYRIMIVAHDIPFPPDHGGKLDTWNRILGFAALKVKLQLLYWYDKKPASEIEMRVMSNMAEDVIEHRRMMTPADLFSLKYPPRMMSCRIMGRHYEDLLKRAEKFQPDCIWLDLWYGFLTARALCNDLKIPLIYRAQNVEFQLYQRNYAVAHGFLKFKLFLNLIRMKRAEYEIRATAEEVYDISANDASMWKAIAPELNSEVLLPTWHQKLQTDSCSSSTEYGDIDILFVGNLFNPSNVAGLKWFSETILPAIRLRSPEPLSVVFAGSNPSSETLDLCKEHNIRCIANPASTTELYNASRLVINPQREGSGISLKMIEALLTSKPIVTTTVGLRGMPDSANACFAVADTPEDFAEKVLSCLQNKSNVDIAKRETVFQEHFGLKPLKQIMPTIAELCRHRAQLKGDGFE